MPDFTDVDYVYLYDIDETPKGYHNIFIHKREPDMTIRTPSILLTKSLIQLPEIFPDKRIVPSIQLNVLIVL